jgi:hypothetical protein
MKNGPEKPGVKRTYKPALIAPTTVGFRVARSWRYRRHSS